MPISIDDFDLVKGAYVSTLDCYVTTSSNRNQKLIAFAGGVGQYDDGEPSINKVELIYGSNPDFTPEIFGSQWFDPPDFGEAGGWALNWAGYFDNPSKGSSQQIRVTFNSSIMYGFLGVYALSYAKTGAADDNDIRTGDVTHLTSELSPVENESVHLSACCCSGSYIPVTGLGLTRDAYQTQSYFFGYIHGAIGHELRSVLGSDTLRWFINVAAPMLETAINIGYANTKAQNPFVPNLC